MNRGEPRIGTKDGRNVDPRLGALVGEAGKMEIARPEEAFPIPPGVARELPSELMEGAPGYYALPLIKEPVWVWTVPTYFFVGGAAGASSLLGTALSFRGPRARRLVSRAHWLAAAGDALSAGLLIYDLGRPSRFLNMLRVLRPSSPMSVGSWILSASGAANGAAALFGERRGVVGALGKMGAAVGGLLGMPLAGYTAVLLSTTAVPVWQETRRTMPLLFMSSGVAAAASLLALTTTDPWEQRVLRRYGIAGKAGALVSTLALEREAARVPRVARPLRRGVSGALLATATALTAGSLIASLLPGRSRKREVAAAITGALGSLVLRFAIVQAGRSSSRDPRASFELQRRDAAAAPAVRATERLPAIP